MRRFIFNLESVLTVRKKALENERIILAKILNDLNAQKNKLNNLVGEFKKLEFEANEYQLKEDFNPMILCNIYSYLTNLTSEIEAQKNLIEQINIRFLQQQNKAQDAYIKVETLNKLKEKQKEEYNKEFLLKEIKELDDIVNFKRKTA